MKDVSGWEAPDWFGQPLARDGDYPGSTLPMICSVLRLVILFIT